MTLICTELRTLNPLFHSIAFLVGQISLQLTDCEFLVRSPQLEPKQFL